MGGLIWWSLVTPNFQCPLAAKICIRPPDVLEVKQRARGPLSLCQVWWQSDFIRHRGGEKRWVFLSVRHAFTVTSVTSRLWTSEFVRPISPWRRWNTEMILMPLDRGRFVVVHPCSTFSDCRQLSTSLNAEVQKNGKNWGFSPPEGDRINRSRQILTRKRLLWVSCSTPDLALIGNRGSV